MRFRSNINMLPGRDSRIDGAFALSCYEAAIAGLARLMLVVVLGVFSAGASELAFAEEISAYRLGPGDEIQIEVIGEEKHDFKIGITGEISYPQLREINVKNKTIEEVRDILLQGLGGRIFKSPQIRSEEHTSELQSH